MGVSAEAAGPDVYLAVHTMGNPPIGDNTTQFASHNAFGWTELETVALEPQMSHAQITWDIGPAGPFPMLFYVSGEPGSQVMKHSTLELGDTWQAPVMVSDSWIVGSFDVTTRPMLKRNILGLGEQPTCPCGSILHNQFIPGEGWSESESMTANHASYDWPMSPNLAIDPDGRVHAFWYQLASAPDMQPWRKTLEYRVLGNGTWTDEGAFMNQSARGCGLGRDVAITVNPSPFPVLAWSHRDSTDGVPNPEAIWIARTADTSSVPEAQFGLNDFDLAAWPNPFNPRIRISFHVERSQNILLNVYDARGHKVASLLDQVVGSGKTQVNWEGKDDAGFSLPSGVYFAQLVSEDGKSVLKMVLTE